MSTATTTPTPKVDLLDRELPADLTDANKGTGADAGTTAKPEQPAIESMAVEDVVAAVTAADAEKAPAKKAAAEKAPAKKAPAKKSPAAKKAPAKAATPAKAAKATPPRDLTKVTAKEQSELRRFVLNMVWATPLWKYRTEAGIPGEVTDQAVLDAIDVFTKYIHPASYTDGKRRS